MATPHWQSDSSVSENLFQEAYCFEFFQAVRLLEHIWRERACVDPEAARAPVGKDATPEQEIARFRVLPSFNFPAGDIAYIKEVPPQDEEFPASPPEMCVAFMGLTGSSGVLPEHYTDLLIRRIRAKDFALRDFLDLFNHRSISLFYRAWEKYRFPIAWERDRLDANVEDLFTWCLRCLIGIGTEHLSGRLAVSDDVLLYYAGHFAHRPRSAVALQSLLAEYLGLPVRVEQFQGWWLYLSEDEQTRLPGLACPDGQYDQLGINAVVGERVWDVRSKFRLRLGPLDYEQFNRLMPGGEALLSLCQLTRTYVGPEFAFDVQLVLQAEKVLSCRLESDGGYAPRLGWNTWLGSTMAFGRDADDAAFQVEGI